MSTFETPAQFERDLRSVNKEWKRVKDSTTKWSFGPVVYLAVDGTENYGDKTRPRGKHSQSYHSHRQKLQANMVKMRARNLPAGRVRERIHLNDEMKETSRSIAEILPRYPMTRRLSAADNVLYSFDRAETPGKPLALDVFVKKSGRETEKLVEKEYEVLDGNGEALKGRKARRHLRKLASDPAASETTEQDDGFELV